MPAHGSLSRSVLVAAALGVIAPVLPSLPAAARDAGSRGDHIVLAASRSSDRGRAQGAERRAKRRQPRREASRPVRREPRKTEPRARRETAGTASAKPAPRGVDPDRRTAAEAIAEAAEEEALVSVGIVTEEQLAEYADQPEKLELLEQVYSEAAELGVDDPEKVKGYQDRAIAGGDAALEEVRQEMVVDGLGLSEAALEQGLTAEEMLDIVGTIGELGGADLVDLGSGELWNQIGTAGPGSVYTEVLIEGHGLPEDLGGLTADAILEGMGAIGGAGGNWADGANWDLYGQLQSGAISLGEFESGVAKGGDGAASGGGPGAGAVPDGSPDVGVPIAAKPGGADPAPGGGAGTESSPSPGGDGSPSPGAGESPAPAGGGEDPSPAAGGAEPGVDTAAKDESGGGDRADATPEGGEAGDTPGAGDAGSGPTIVDKVYENIGGATWVTTVFSTGDYVMNLVDNQTGEVLETREGKAQTLPEGETVEGKPREGGDGDSGGGGEADTAETDEPPDEYTPGPDGEGMTPEQQRALAEQMGLTESLTDYLGRKLADVVFGAQTGSADSTPDPAGGGEGGGTAPGGPDSVVDPGDPANPGLAAPDALSVEAREALLQGEIGGGVTDPAD